MRVHRRAAENNGSIPHLRSPTFGSIQHRRLSGGARPAVPILESNDVVQLGRARFQHDGVFEGGHPVTRAGAKVDRLAGKELEGLETFLGGADLELEAARLNRHRLLLRFRR